jgi:D-alanyl-D-alanine dipeptidase
MGHEDGEVSERTHPEYFETHSNAQEQPSNNRRILYSLMTQIGGFSVNPSEWWYYDLGNQLHAMCSGETAYYAEAPTKTTTG